VDWNQTNKDIAAAFGATSATVSKYRKLYGHKRPNGLAIKFNDFNFGALDWGKNDYALARENPGMPITAFRRYRHVHKIAPGGNPIKIVSEAAIAAADWVNNRDVDLSKVWGVTRERVRQLRIERSKPTCTVKNQNTSAIAAVRWLKDHAAELEGKHANEIAKLMPYAGKKTLTVGRKLIKRAGIQCDWTDVRTGIFRRYANFNLPNAVLSKIWGIGDVSVAVRRREDFRVKAKWNLAGQQGCRAAQDPMLTAATIEEIEKAQFHGKQVDRTDILNYLAHRAHPKQTPATV
jgi:hypothetical protein